ncbi:MAG: hypothetical protein M3Z16_00365 [Pseudomonadota bacterium]|nr:hypothetical protein [Pseudomonadota bacterium]
MQVQLKMIVALSAAALTGIATAQPATTSVGRAASAAVTPGDQDMGRNPQNRSGGLMGNDRTGTDSANTSGRRRVRSARADRG